MWLKHLMQNYWPMSSSHSVKTTVSYFMGCIGTGYFAIYKKIKNGELLNQVRQGTYPNIYDIVIIDFKNRSVTFQEQKMKMVLIRFFFFLPNNVQTKRWNGQRNEGNPIRPNNYLRELINRLKSIFSLVVAPTILFQGRDSQLFFSVIIIYR